MKCAEQDNLLNTPISQTLGAILRWMNDDNDDYDDNDNDHSDNDDNLLKIHQYLKTFIILFICKVLKMWIILDFFVQIKL